MLNYADDPVNSVSRYILDPDYFLEQPLGCPPETKVIHGHFSPNRYAHYDGMRFVTFLRHPVENMISIYFHWMAHRRDQVGNPLHGYFLDNGLTIEQIARLPLLRWLFSRTYFGGFDMGRFDFIGDLSTYDQDLIRLGDLIGSPLSGSLLNVNRFKTAEVDSEFNYFSAISDRRICNVISNYLIDDLRFYDKVMRLRANLRQI